MSNLVSTPPSPRNEPVLNYAPGSPEKKILKAKITELASSQVDIPVIINGKEIRTGKTENVVSPHAHQKKLGVAHEAGVEEVRAAIEGAMKVAPEWARTPWETRAAIFLKAAELLATKYRPILNGSTMLGQSKTCYQAEIDSACEMIDFWKFNAQFQRQIYSMQPESGPGQWNRMEYRPLEGFVFAVSPFNFTSIAGNLTGSPVLMGNVCIWKPATTSIYSNYFLMKLFEEAGMPPGVIQFLPGPGSVLGDMVFKDPNFAGLHFTGSTNTFQNMWKTVADNIKNYRTYPRLVGETGGKDFVFAHASADLEVLATALIRGAFEYQGQKCSAASRAYIPKSLWPKLKERMVEELKTVKVGDPTDFKSFMGAVIDKKSFANIKNYIEGAKKDSGVKIVFGGSCDDREGYFVEPTVIEAENPKYRTMCEEIFGPVLTIHVYDDAKLDETLTAVDETSPYALTGAVIAQDKRVVAKVTERLCNAAGNFYINNKPTGAVVGQQPFGGARGSGTNDKAGSYLNLLRWTSVRTLSETFSPPTNYRYSFLEES